MIHRSLPMTTFERHKYMVKLGLRWIERQRDKQMFFEPFKDALAHKLAMDLPCAVTVINRNSVCIDGYLFSQSINKNKTGRDVSDIYRNHNGNDTGALRQSIDR